MKVELQKLQTRVKDMVTVHIQERVHRLIDDINFENLLPLSTVFSSVLASTALQSSSHSSTFAFSARSSSSSSSVATTTTG